MLTFKEREVAAYLAGDTTSAEKLWLANCEEEHLRVLRERYLSELFLPAGVAYVELELGQLSWEIENANR